MEYSVEYVKTLEKEFLKRKEKNQRYSLRAFSNFLGIQSSTLSGVLNKTRHLSTKDAAVVADKLFSPADSVAFLESFFAEKSKAQGEGFLPDDASFFPLLSGWEHGAIFSLMNTHDFKDETKWIAQRLNITEQKASDSLNYLENIGLIKKDESNRYVKTNRTFATSQDVESEALKIGHLKELDLARLKQDEIAVEDREFGSLTFAINKKDLPKIKNKIRAFSIKLENQFEGENNDEVYFFTYQLFPVTQMDDSQKVLQ